MYITVLSSYCRDVFPNNNTSSFSNNLAEPVHLQSGIDYEIALASLSYNANHYIQSGLSFAVFDWTYDNGDGTWGTMIELTIAHAIINNSEDLCSHLNSLIWANLPRFKESQKEFFSYGKNRRIWINFDDSIYLTIILRSALLIVIGAVKKDNQKDIIILGKTKPAESYQFNGKTRIFKDKRPFKSSSETRDYMAYEPDIGLTDEIIIYSDLVRSSHVANSMSNILKFSVITRRRDQNGEEERRVLEWGANRTYQDLVCKDIYQMRFDIRSVHGEPVKLKEYIRLQIHIREKKK